MGVPLPLQVGPMAVSLLPQPLSVSMRLQVSPLPVGLLFAMGAMSVRPLIRWRPV
jgi:hypothetical protein